MKSNNFYFKKNKKNNNSIISFDLSDFLCFTRDYILTGFERDQAVKRRGTGALDSVECLSDIRPLLGGFITE
jgi:hypothetical protein